MTEKELLELAFKAGVNAGLRKAHLLINNQEYDVNTGLADFLDLIHEKFPHINLSKEA